MFNKEGCFKAKALKLDSGSYVEFARTNNGGFQVYARFKIVDGEDAGESLPWYGSLAGGGVEITVKGLRAMGFVGDDLEDAPSQDLSNEVQITVKQNDYQGKISYRVAFVNPLYSQGVKPENRVSGQELKMFAATMRSKIQSLGIPSAPKRTPPQPEREPGCDDDIPL